MMAVSRQSKDKVAVALTGDLAHAGSVVLADFTGINAENMTELRKTLRENGIQFEIVKNTILRRVFRQIDVDETDGVYALMSGPTALAYAKDEVLPIRVLKKFAETHGGMPSVKGGFVSRHAYGRADMMQLADIPSREVLLSKFLGSASMPIQGFVMVTSGIIRKFFYALNALRESKDNGQG
jgi:large subunit ribosomal protein L10